MRMLLTIFCLIFCLSNTAHALATIETCKTGTDTNTCNAIAGCYWNSGTCTPCPAGTYKDRTGTSCTECPNDKKHTDTDIHWHPYKTGQTSVDECWWRSKCHISDKVHTGFGPDGGCKYCQEKNDDQNNIYYYFDSHGIIEGTLNSPDTDYTNTSCKKCGYNTEETKNGDRSCKCKPGYKKEGSSIIDCEPANFTITYMCNVNETATKIYTQSKKYPWDDDIPDLITYTEKFNLAFVQTKALSEYSKTCTKLGHELTAWQTSNTDTTKLFFKIKSSASAPEEYTEVNMTSGSAQWNWASNLTVYPVWVPANITCNAGEYVDATTAQCTECPAGFYCPGVENESFNNTDMRKEQCPDGSTSDTGSIAITDCYLNTGLTQFCINTTEPKPTCFMIQHYASTPYYTNKQ